ncbi:ferrous iron transport protein B [Prevotella sp. A2931]|uniref:Ferrous iron transport protein B n=1 Tax=Prevotella illustrans TaxID=2800387 RepID=A0ABS3M7K5_9BACT|nr:MULTISPECIES: ferrous iron transport protein B [Prevotella]MBO1364168.1 ferrous iron transport protein B [Prevotella illustrans]PTL25011.1 ferrous iron transport protein B [Prevotella sp. oral taxon 820]
MRLSELKTGEHGIIVKVTGHGGFRKRVVEMGFIKGKKVTVLLNAPLHDPVKYQIMGYEVSLRHSEADKIEVISEDEAKALNLRSSINASTPEFANLNANSSSDTDKLLESVADKQRHTINIALVGNPNCGKTSFFNFASGAHERVGNYSGVTVDAKVGHASFEGYEFEIVDLPGTYSLSAYSPEELYVRKQIIDQTPDVIVNVIDTSNLERNLYLTTQLIDMHVRMVCALNMFDESMQRGDHVDYDKLGELFGVTMVPTIFTTGKGVDELFRAIIKTYEGTEDTDPHFRHIHINHGHEIENGILEIQEHLKQEENLRARYSTRYLAIKLLEHDKDVEDYIKTLPDAQEIFEHRDMAAQRVKEETGDDSETAIMDAKYGFIHGALKEAEYLTGSKKNTYQMTHFLDRIITNKYVGFPIFFFMLFIMFSVTFIVGQYPMDWIEQGVSLLGELVSGNMPEGPLKDMLIDGILGGVGAVIVFLPQILILYFFISFMEDSGYMSRAAFIMDKLMHKMGLHGKSFIPLIMGFGCNVPAVMATRTIESRRSRIITMLILPFMSCSARLPIYIMITGSFFALKYRSLVLMLLYAIGVMMAVAMSRLFSRTVFKGEDTPFVMELPPYRFPTWKAMGRHTWEKGKQYLKKMGGIILVASIIVWALGYFPHNDQLTARQQQEQSFIGKIGKTIEPVFMPQGFDWKLDVGLLAGIGAKEIVASTMGVLYSDNDSFGDDNSYNDHGGKYEILHKQLVTDIAKLHNIQPARAESVATLTAFCFLLFVLLYFPCIATIAAIKGETGSWKWAIFTAVYTTGLAWIVSAAVFQIGKLFL